MTGASRRPLRRALGLRASAALALAAGLSAAAVPGKVADPVAVLVQVRQEWTAERHERALERLAVLEESDLADHVALIRAQILREAERGDDAITAARRGLQRDPPSELAARLRHTIARLLLDREDLVGAYREQRLAWEASRDPETSAALAMEMARSFDERMRPGDALRLYRQIWQTWPHSEPSDAAYDRSLVLAEATGAPDPPAEAFLEYAERLRGAYRCERALPAYERALDEPELDAEGRSDAVRGRALCLFGVRRYPEAASAFGDIVAADPKDGDARIRIARSHARAGQTRLALEELRAISESSDRAARARARYLRAILLRDRTPARAEELFRQVERQRAVPDLARAARWELAWQNLLRGEHEQAQKRLAPLARGSLWDIEAQRARYWRALARLELDAREGRKDLRELAEDLPLSYYGLIAAQRLGESPTLERSFVGERSDPEERTAQRAQWLLEAGFTDLARDEVESWLRSSPRLDRATRLVAARLLHGVGDHFQAVRTVVDGFGGALEQGIDPAWREAWQLAWPRAFNAPVSEAAAEFEFDPALVYAVMREESTYRPDVASPAGAMGLMQIIPKTGDRIASTLGVPAYSADILLEPDTNIRFGTFYLKRLLRRFDSEVLAIAAYNAGPTTVSQWLKRDGRLAHDAFVESVPYGETRRYLRRVVRSRGVYRLLYDGGL